MIEDGQLLLVLDPSAVAERALSEQARSSAIHPTGNGKQPAAAGGPVRVLVVDDSLTTRTLEKNILAAAGFDVLVAADGREGLRVARRERPDIVVADVDMPRLDGLAMTRQLKADDETRHVPVILVTAAESPEQQERGFDAGADAYITKSTFSQQQLLQAIRELVG
jgi:two-component system chemotaxis sensor kinase CheA